MNTRLDRSALAALDLYTVYIGERLGFYRALAADGPATSTELSDRTGTNERLVREWLEQQAATGLLTVDDAAGAALERRYAIRDEEVPALADADHPSFTAHEAIEMVRNARSLPDVVESFRTGNAPPPLTWEPEGRAEWNRAKYLAKLGREWLPAVEPIDRRLKAVPPAKVADLACGTGWSSIAMAQAYPSIVVHGRDLDADAVATARDNAAARGLGDRVTFAVADASHPADPPYDLVTILEALHDMTRPVEVLRTAREMLAPGGSVLVADERVSDAFTADASERDRYVHGISVVACLPDAMGDPDSAMTGAVMRVDILRHYAADAGFGTVETLPVTDDDLRFYRLVP
ncbi:class I SAM-dependent methyltransferase [Agromyces humatus]|nr:class I SAM-dependent methyltransferase [Agromyces humatus]